jgi:hypothetical protein
MQIIFISSCYKETSIKEPCSTEPITEIILTDSDKALFFSPIQDTMIFSDSLNNSHFLITSGIRQEKIEIAILKELLRIINVVIHPICLRTHFISTFQAVIITILYRQKYWVFISLGEPVIDFLIVAEPLICLITHRLLLIQLFWMAVYSRIFMNLNRNHSVLKKFTTPKSKVLLGFVPIIRMDYTYGPKPIDWKNFPSFILPYQYCELLPDLKANKKQIESSNAKTHQHS